MKKILLALILCLVFSSNIVLAKDRCQDYISDIRTYAIMYNTLSFPYWYNIGCAMTESNCRGNITSFDAGQGLMQLTPSTGITAEIRKYIPVDPYNTTSSIRAQSYYIMLIRTKKFNVEKVTVKKRIGHPKAFVKKCGLNLADVYKYYNGGAWFFVETEIGGTVCDNKEMRKLCVRGGTWVGSGKNRRYLNFCDINYDYPTKVFDFSSPYKMGKDGQPFWYEEPKIEEPVKMIDIKLPVIKEIPIYRKFYNSLFG